jgi:hypothetical protein
MNILNILLIFWIICFVITFIVESIRDKRPMGDKICLMIVLAGLGFLFVPFYFLSKPLNNQFDDTDIIQYAESIGFWTEDGKLWHSPNSTKLCEIWELPTPPSNL